MSNDNPNGRLRYALRLASEAMALVSPRKPAVDGDFVALRRILWGGWGSLAPGEAAGVARAARCGEVGVLAARSHPALASALAPTVQRQTLIDMALEQATIRAAACLERAGLAERVVLLKGSATAYTLYDEPVERFRRDVDLLLADEDMVVAVDALRAGGWRDDSDSHDPRRARAWCMIYDTAVGAMSVDLHRRLFSARGFSPDEAGILKRAERGERAPLPVPTAEDVFLHTALHIAKNGFQEPLKAWLDLARLSSVVDWDLLVARARRWRCRNALYGCALVLKRWFGGCPVPPLSRIGTSLPGLEHLLAGEGAHPLRREVSRHAATGATAIWLSDDWSGRGEIARAWWRGRG